MTASEKILLVAQGITIIIILLTLVVYYFQLHTMRKTMLHQVIRDILMEYRSAEMMIAVQSLWTFYRKHPNNFVEVYVRTKEQDEQSNALLPIPQRIEAERFTLHYFRRLVSQYYAMLAVLYTNNIFPKDILYSYWSEGDLRIIPNILIPIEKKLAEMFGTSVENDLALSRLNKLYDDSK